jgi:methyl-accepting chemotaxis protein
MAVTSQKRGLSFKLVLWIGGTVFLVLLASALFILGEVFTLEKRSAGHYLEAIAASHAASLQSDMEGAMTTARLVSHSLTAFSDLTAGDRRAFADSFLQKILTENPGYSGLWACYEPNQFDGLDANYRNKGGHDETGRFIPHWFRKYSAKEATSASVGTGSDTAVEEITINRAALSDYLVPGKGDYYLLARNAKRELIVEPYVGDAGKSDALITSIVTPIKNRYGKILGVTGVDIKLDSLALIILNEKVYRTGYLELITSKGTVAASPDPKAIGSASAEFSGEAGKQRLERLLEGERVLFSERAGPGTKALTRSCIPIFIGNALEPWIVVATAPTSETLEYAVYMMLKVAAVFAGGILLIIALIAFLARSFLKPIKIASTALEEIAEGQGDLTMRIDVTSKDEIGKLSGEFNKFIARLESIIKTIREATNRLIKVGQGLASNVDATSASVYQINENIENVNQAVTNQAAGITETSSTIREISTSIERLSATIAKQGEDISDSSASVEEMVANIESVTRTLEKNGEQFVALKDSSDTGFTKIADVAQRVHDVEERSEGLSAANATIKNIATQTNLLAMNAAIEAAHAGESGKGFAVVADEIRKLAEEASTQSRSISKELQALKNAIDQVALSSTDAGNAFNSVRESIGVVLSQQEQIRRAMEEQSTGNSRVLEALTRLREQSGTLTSSAHEISGGSRAILDEMGELVSITQDIKERMDKMRVGTADIGKAIGGIVALSHENSDGISAVSGEVGRFTVGES